MKDTYNALSSQFSIFKNKKPTKFTITYDNHNHNKYAYRSFGGTGGARNPDQGWISYIGRKSHQRIKILMKTIKSGESGIQWRRVQKLQECKNK